MTQFEKILCVGLFIAVMALQLLAFNDRFIGVFNNFSQMSQQRLVLAKIDTPLKKAGPSFRFVKILTGNAIFLEAYSLGKTDYDDEASLLAHVKLPEKRDAYLTTNLTSTNLAASDLDRDGLLEILVPTFNDELMPRLRAYRYLPEEHLFELIEPSLGK